MKPMHLTNKHFTRWWHFRSVDLWNIYLEDYIPSNGLEIGSFEGLSACWFLDQYEHAHLTCIDIFAECWDDPTGEYEKRFDHNTREYGERLLKIKGDSHQILQTLSNEQYDFIYLDGHHEYEHVLEDLRLCYPLLKTDGILICDDYNNDEFGVRQATTEYLTNKNYMVLSEKNDYQFAIKKL